MKCLKKYNLNENVIGTYSNNGWSNCGILKIAINQIYLKTEGKKSVLVLDKFKAHTSDVIVNYAKEKNITLIFIPEGTTYKYQPLDVLINGFIKQKGKKSWREEQLKNKNIEIKNKDSVVHFLNAFDSLNNEIIKKSFAISCLKLEK